MLQSLAFWGSLPFIALQAIRVRRLALRLPAASGPSSGVVGFGPRFRLLAIGDSIVAGVGASTLDKALVGRTADSLASSLRRRVNWHAVGRSGIRTGGALNELVPSLPGDFVDAFLVSIGVNDVTALTRSSVWRRDLERLLCALETHSPDAVLAVAGLPPFREFPLLPEPLRSVIARRGERLDRVAREVIARHPNALHVAVRFESGEDRFCADGFHPSEASYADLGRAMATQLALRFAAPG